MNALGAVQLNLDKVRSKAGVILAWTVACVGAVLVGVFAVSLMPAFTFRLTALNASQSTGLDSLGLSPQGYVFAGLALQALVAASYFLVAAILLILARGSIIAILSAAVLAGTGAAAMQTISALPAMSSAWEWPVHLIETAALATFFLWLLAFPTGRIPQQRGRWVAGGIAVLSLVQAANIGAWRPFLAPAWAVAGFLVAAVLLAGRRRAANGAPAGLRCVGIQLPTTQGLRPILLAFLACLLSLIVATLGQAVLGWVPGTFGDLVLQLSLVAAFLAVPATVAAAVLRQGLWDLKGALARSVTASLMTFLALATYLLFCVLAAVVDVDRTAASMLAIMVVLLAVHPLYGRAARRVNRVLYGERGSSRAILAQLDRQLAAAGDAAELIAGVAEGVRSLLNIPFVRIVVGDGLGSPRVRLAGTFVPDWPLISIPLVHQGFTLGTLELALRDADHAINDDLSPEDLAAVNPIAEQLSSLLRGVELDIALRAAHHKLVAARESERRRLRDDLHDGVGPALGAVLLNLAAAHNVLSQGDAHGADPGEARIQHAQNLIDDSRTAVKQSIAEIRKLVYELRPPALDERGPVEAVRAAVAPLGEGPMNIVVVSTAEPSALPPSTLAVADPSSDGQDNPEVDRVAVPRWGAVVESAAYRIALEAVHNASRHSGARQCTVRFCVDDHWLRLEIADDGAGLPCPVTAGVGMESMAQRAGEAGGTLSFAVPPDGGTAVVARLPLTVAPAANVQRPFGPAPEMSITSEAGDAGLSWVHRGVNRGGEGAGHD